MKNNLHETNRLKNVLNFYESKSGINANLERISEADGKILFNLLIDDYKEGLVSVDDLSLLCEMMYAKFDRLSDMYFLLLNGAEIEWYIRNEPDVAADFISDLLKAFK
ncbi:MAG: hypothetical protein M3Q81_02655 [bacterium]|nr:hypothetical protein [bacterium]